jgi:hypothetical protein
MKQMIGITCVIFTLFGCSVRNNGSSDQPEKPRTFDATIGTFHLVRTFGINECDQFDSKQADVIAKETPDIVDLIQQGVCPKEIGVIWSGPETAKETPDTLDDGGYEMAKEVGKCQRDGFVTHFYESSVQNGEVEPMTEAAAKEACDTGSFTGVGYAGTGFIGTKSN